MRKVLFGLFSINKVKIKKEYLDYLYLGAFFIVVLSFITGTLVSSIGYSMVVIDNPDPNSMWPTYFQGDLFVLEDADPSEIVLGDVIVYEKAGGEKIIHRVIDILKINDVHYFRVKGDNPITNPPDVVDGSTLIKETSVLGKIIFRIPYLGHLSLAMQRNTGIQFFIYFVAILFGIAIVFWPDDEEDEEGGKSKKDDYIEITGDSLISAGRGIVSSPITIFRRAKTSKHRKGYTALTAVIIILLIIPTIIPNFVNTPNTPSGIGILGVETGKTSLYSDTLNGQDYSFYFIQLEVTIYDNEGLWKRITGFTVDVFTTKDDPNTLISSTKWKSLRDFKGSVTTGGSILIRSENQPTDNTTMFIKIKLTWVEYFFEKSLTKNYELIYHIP